MPFLSDTDFWLVTCAARLRELAAPCPAGETHDAIALALHGIAAYRGFGPVLAAEAFLRAMAHREAA